MWRHSLLYNRHTRASLGAGCAVVTYQLKPATACQHASLVWNIAPWGERENFEQTERPLCRTDSWGSTNGDADHDYVLDVRLGNLAINASHECEGKFPKLSHAGDYIYSPHTGLRHIVCKARYSTYLPRKLSCGRNIAKSCALRHSLAIDSRRCHKGHTAERPGRPGLAPIRSDR